MCLIYDFYINNLIVCWLNYVLVMPKTLNPSLNSILIIFIKLK